jgi:hypothetical protein
LFSPFLMIVCAWTLIRITERRIRLVDARVMPRGAHGTSTSQNKRREKRITYINQTLITHTWAGLQVPDDTNDNEKEEAITASISSGNTDVISVSGSSGSKLSCSDDDVCPICLNGFHRNSIVCESNNLACCHQYHKECMIGWLMKHDVCPICRERYLVESA